MKVIDAPQDFVVSTFILRLRKHNLEDYATKMATCVNNISGETSLRSLLKASGCETYASDMRVSSPLTSSYFYPDVVVICEEPRFEDDVFDILLNPTILVEVPSASTEAYDRGEKFGHYRHLASLQEYIPVSQDKVLVERYRRPKKHDTAPVTAKDWIFTAFQALEDILPLTSIECELPLQEIYERVTFPD